MLDGELAMAVFGRPMGGVCDANVAGGYSGSCVTGLRIDPSNLGD